MFAESISGRDTMGPLGMGWSTSWQTSASVASDGTVTISEPGGAERVFQPDSRTPGHYFSQPGDTGTLTADGSRRIPAHRGGRNRHRLQQRAER